MIIYGQALPLSELLELVAEELEVDVVVEVVHGDLQLGRLPDVPLVDLQAGNWQLQLLPDSPLMEGQVLRGGLL